VTLQIRDDGVGFRVEDARHSGGVGLRGIMERAELMSASVKIESEPGQGTLLRVEVPL
jgi:signal transduction histidine kinase